MALPVVRPLPPEAAAGTAGAAVVKDARFSTVVHVFETERPTTSRRSHEG
jgi:hypothetical protein